MRLAAPFIVSLTAFALLPASPAAANLSGRCAEAEALLDHDPAAALSLMQSVSRAEQDCIGGAVHADLITAYAEFKAGGMRIRDASRLKRPLRAFEESGGAPSRLVGLAQIAVAHLQLAEINEKALATAKRAEASFLAGAPDDVISRSRAIVWQAAARLIKRPNFSADLMDAFEDASRARALFGETPDATEPAFLETIAWQAAILGLIAGDARAQVDESAAAKALAVVPSVICDAPWTRAPLATVKHRRSWTGSLMSSGVLLGAVARVDASDDGAAALGGVAAEARFPSLQDTTNAERAARDRAVSRALERWRVEAAAPADCKSGILVPLGAYRPERSGEGNILNELPLDIGRTQ